MSMLEGRGKKDQYMTARRQSGRPTEDSLLVGAVNQTLLVAQSSAQGSVLACSEDPLFSLCVYTVRRSSSNES